MKVHIESMCGFYHGQDPRTFTPDTESCTAKEMAAHKEACDKLNAGETIPANDSGCHFEPGKIVCKTTFGIGTYEVVMDSEGNYIRDASFEDIQREGQWEEDCTDFSQHEWENGYYGHKCKKCGVFIVYGSEPWMPNEPPR